MHSCPLLVTHSPYWPTSLVWSIYTQACAKKLKRSKITKHFLHLDLIFHWQLVTFCSFSRNNMWDKPRGRPWRLRPQSRPSPKGWPPHSAQRSCSGAVPLWCKLWVRSTHRGCPVNTGYRYMINPNDAKEIALDAFVERDVPALLLCTLLLSNGSRFQCREDKR